MKIADLHKLLHPKLKPYSGDGKSYRHPLSTDMDVTISRAGVLKWVVEVHERGLVHSNEAFCSEAKACEEVLRIARAN